VGLLINFSKPTLEIRRVVNWLSNIRAFVAIGQFCKFRVFVFIN
jgi:hypothetical protein